ncbi:MAG: FAD-dependent oxidoreductase [Xanthobacteraceae bacterium]|nr:FAD-dependent oxidoreductase [Xanthobacteraceae bacterium]
MEETLRRQGPGTQTLTTRCCVVGGGPAGMMVGFLLARAGVDVVVLEKHGDFLRDFRGDTIHPSTLEFMHELGLLDQFLALPHQELRELTAQIGETRIKVVDFGHLPTVCKFIALMPQWDFLNFLAAQGQCYPNFKLLMRAEATDVLREGERVTGVRVTTPEGPRDIEADLTIGADGRHSTVRARAGLTVKDLGAPMDVLWMRVSRRSDDQFETLGRIDVGHIFIMLNRGDYWQCAYVIRKGGADEVRQQGLPAFRASILKFAPLLGDRVEELRSWDDVKLLTVAVDRLAQWYCPGLLCIGDAAHAMSPIGGVGINLAVQDAVAAANLLYAPLRRGQPTLDELAAVQKRREFPMRFIQGLQLFVQNRIITRVLASTQSPKPPFAVMLLDWWPPLRRIPARILGLGVQREHVHTPDAGVQVSPS